MKSIYFPFLILLSLPMEAFSQPTEIIYDMGTKNFQVYTLESGDHFYVTVKGVNTYCYDVKVESESQLDTTKYFVPSITSLPIGVITGLFSATTPLSLDGIMQSTSTGSLAPTPFSSSTETQYIAYNTMAGINAKIARKSWWDRFLSSISGESNSERLEKLMNSQIKKLKELETKKNNHNDQVNTWLAIAKNHTYSPTSLSFNVSNFLGSPIRPKESDIASFINVIKEDKSIFIVEAGKFPEELKKPKLQQKYKEIINVYDNTLVTSLTKLKSLIASSNVNSVIGNIAKKRINYEWTLISILDGQINSLPNSIRAEEFKIQKLETKMKFDSNPTDFLTHDHRNQATNMDVVFQSNISSAEALVKNINLSLTAYQKELDHILQRMEPKKDLSLAHKEVEKAYTKRVDVTQNHVKNIDSTKLNTLHDRLLAISQNVTFEYSSQPFYFRGDKGWIKITLTPKNRCIEVPRFNPIIEPFPKKGKSRFATTSSFYISTLSDDNYSLITELQTNPGTNNIDTIFKAIDEENGNLEFGTSIMMNYILYNNDKDDIHFSFNIGPGISFSNSVRLRLLTGVGVSLGKRHRFAIGAGVISGYSDRISKAVDLENSLKVKPDRLTVSKLSAAVYFNVGYQYRFNW